MNKYESYIPIKHWAEADRPREKFRKLGKHAISNSELIAIVLGSGSSSESALELARRILQQYKNDLSKIAVLQINDLKRFKGIGEVKAISLMAAFELGRRYHLTKPVQKAVIRSSQDAFAQLNEYLADQSQEEFWILLLNRRNAVLGCERISIGGMTATVVDAKVVFSKTLSYKATSLILSHNHPSGQMRPSEKDIRLTKKLKQAGSLLDIAVLDHLIICGKEFFSFADEGLM
jgi:DNA repair protein RadC